MLGVVDVLMVMAIVKTAISDHGGSYAIVLWLSEPIVIANPLLQFALGRLIPRIELIILYQ